MEKATDVIPLQGELKIIVRRRGKVVEEWQDKNLIVNLPRQRIARLLAEGAGSLPKITQIAVGTNSTPPSGSDTQITSAFVKPLSGFTYVDPQTVRFDFIILESEANGKNIVEFGLIAADGTLFARRTRTGAIVKDTDVEIEGSWTIYI